MLTISPEMKKVFKGHNYSGEIIMTSLFMKCRYSLSYREVEEIGSAPRVALSNESLASMAGRLSEPTRITR